MDSEEALDFLVGNLNVADEKLAVETILTRAMPLGSCGGAASLNAAEAAGERRRTGRAKRRSYTASLPFNILAVDQGEPDWYADDWGERP